MSQNFIILGASSGGLYVFRRQPCEFIQLLPNKVCFQLLFIKIIITKMDVKARFYYKYFFKYISGDDIYDIYIYMY